MSTCVFFCFVFSRDTVNATVLARNVKVVAESLARQVFNLPHDGHHEIFTEGLVRTAAVVVLFLNNQSWEMYCEISACCNVTSAPGPRCFEEKTRNAW